MGITAGLYARGRTGEEPLVEVPVVDRGGSKLLGRLIVDWFSRLELTVGMGLAAEHARTLEAFARPSHLDPDTWSRLRGPEDLAAFWIEPAPLAEALVSFREALRRMGALIDSLGPGETNWMSEYTQSGADELLRDALDEAVRACRWAESEKRSIMALAF